MRETRAHYFTAFADYLRTGEKAHLITVFPGADDLSVAGVYRNGYIKGCSEALRASYPVVERLVGEEYFTFLAGSYVDLHPPKRATFIGYGERFPEFLAQIRDQHQLPYLADFARLDKSWLKAYFAADSELLCEQDIELWQQAGHAIESLAVCLPESTQLLSLQYPVSELWLLLKSEQAPATDVTMPMQVEQLMVWRDAQDQVNLRVLNPVEYAFCELLATGNSLGPAASEVLALDRGFPLLAFFSELLNNDLLAVR